MLVGIKNCMEKKSGILKNEKIGLFLCCVFCFLAHVVVINQFNGWFCTDTDGYWLHAATFTGHDWSGVASKVSMYYAWGYSVLLMIPMLLSDDILVMSRIVVVMNSILCALTIPLLYSIGKKMFAEVKNWVIMVSALITSLYSAYFINSAVALAELFIYFLYTLLIWLVFQYLDSQKWYWGLLSSICCGYLYITHHRNLGMVVAYGVLVCLLLVKNRNWKEIFYLVVPLVMMFLFDVAVNDWLNAREMLGAEYTTNTYGAVASSSLRIFTLEGLIAVIQGVIGDIWYLLTGTFMLAGVGASYIVRKITESKENKEIREWIFDKKFIYGIYLFINILMLIGITSVFFMKGSNLQGRMDGIFYGRYFECTIGILIFVGVIAVSHLNTRQELLKDIQIVILFAICLSIITYYFTKEISGTGINFFSVAAVLFPFSYPNLSFSILTSSICLLTLGVFFVKLFQQKEVFYRGISYLLIGFWFLYVGYNGTINTKQVYIAQGMAANYPAYNEEFMVMNRCIGGLELESLYICTQDGYEAFSYQLFNTDMKIMTIKEIEEIDVDVCNYAMLPGDSVEEYAVEIEQVLMETPNYVLCKLN